MKNKVNIILSLTSLVVTAVLLVVTLFAWFVTNDEASVSGISLSTNESEDVRFEENVLARRVNLNGDIIDDTYTIGASGNLYLTKRVTHVKETNSDETETYELSDKKPFLIETMLPGEYIDITIGFYLKDSSDGKDYSVKLNSVAGDIFEVDGKSHYASGAFKYKNISLKNSADTAKKDFSSEEYVWLNTYDIDSNDVENHQIFILDGTWDKTDVKLYYTFRIMEDFTQYYALIAKATGSYGALLSNKNLSIGQIYFILG